MNRPRNLLYCWVGPKGIFTNGPFSETGKGFGVGPTPGGSQCTEVSPTLSWKWHRATLSPSFGPFFERNHSFRVKMVSGNVWKIFKSCPLAWNPTGKKQIYRNRRRSYRNRHICKLFHFALSMLNWEIAITPERVAWLTWFLAPFLKSKFMTTLFSKKKWFWPTFTALATPLLWALCHSVADRYR